MEFIRNPSLQQMALVKIVAQLWNQEDIRMLIQDYDLSANRMYLHSEWQKIEHQLELRGSHLPLPEAIKKDLKGTIKPFSRQIHSWYSDLHRECRILTLPAQLFWTPEGSIDKKRTAEMLVKDKNIEVGSRYRLACINCLEDQIPKLWNQIPKQQKRLFQSKNIVENYLVKFWTFQLSGQLSKLDQVTENLTKQRNPHVYGLYRAVEGGNVAATEFFFDKLSDKERNTLLVSYAKKVAEEHLHVTSCAKSYSKVFFFLLQRFNKDQEVQLLTKCPYGVLSCFLNWPHQPSFMDLAERVKPLQPIPNVTYTFVLTLMVKKITNGWTDFDYRQLFLQFWHLSPLSHKTYILGDQMACSFIFSHLFAAREKAIIIEILRGIDVFDRNLLILHPRILRYLVKEEKWEMVEFMLEVCEPTKEVLVEVKDGFVRNNPFMRKNDESDVRRWGILSHLLDELIAKKSND